MIVNDGDTVDTPIYLTVHKIAYVFAPAVLGEEVDGVEGAVLPLAPHHQQALLTALDHAQ